MGRRHTYPRRRRAVPHSFCSLLYRLNPYSEPTRVRRSSRRDGGCGGPVHALNVGFKRPRYASPSAVAPAWSAKRCEHARPQDSLTIAQRLRRGCGLLRQCSTLGYRAAIASPHAALTPSSHLWPGGSPCRPAPPLPAAPDCSAQSRPQVGSEPACRWGVPKTLASPRSF